MTTTEVEDFLTERENDLLYLYGKLFLLRGSRKSVYQVNPKLKNNDGSFPEFIFIRYKDKCTQKWYDVHWLWLTWEYKRKRAKKRRIAFEWAFSEFLDFCRKTNYHLLRGRTKNDMSVDRTENLEGYKMENMQMLTVSQNRIKASTIDKKRPK